jgi:hypothetical protein
MCDNMPELVILWGPSQHLDPLTISHLLMKPT